MFRWIRLVSLLMLFAFPSSPAFAVPINHLWSKGLPGNGVAVAIDAAGNVYVTGNFTGTANFGGASFLSSGSSDVFLAKYSPTGVHLWSKRCGSTGTDRAYAVGVDASGNVAITGDFVGSADFDTATLVSLGGTDVFLARFTTAGGLLGAARYGGTGNDTGFGLAVDASGNIIIGGSFNGTAAFGGASLISAGLTDIFLAKYSSAGAHVWSERWGGTVSDAIQAVAVDPSGNIATTGTFQGTTNLGGSNLLAGSIEAFVARYASTGAHSWSYRLGGPAQDYATGVACDASGNVFCTGYFSGSATFPSATLVAAGGFDIYLLKFNVAGTQQWAQRYGSLNSEYANWVSVDASGNVLLTGMFYDTFNLGGSTLTSNGDTDIFIGELTTAGVHRWSRSFGATQSDRGNVIVASPAGDAIFTGTFMGTADFGAGLIGSFASIGAVIGRYTDHATAPLITSISDIGNDQGRNVRIGFDRAAHDNAASPTPVDHYEAYRRNDAPPAVAIAGLSQLSTQRLLASGWTQVASVDAHAEDKYSMETPTIGDSTIALGQYRSVFYVRAATGAPSMFYDSPPDSGYSVDNLAPGIPQNLFYSAGDITWDKSTADDFDYFTVYGSSTDNFGAATLINYSVSPAMNVIGSPYAFYYVTATDFSGNEGRPAKVTSLSGVGGTPVTSNLWCKRSEALV